GAIPAAAWRLEAAGRASSRRTATRSPCSAISTGCDTTFSRWTPASCPSWWRRRAHPTTWRAILRRWRSGSCGSLRRSGEREHATTAALRAALCRARRRGRSAARRRAARRVGALPARLVRARVAVHRDRPVGARVRGAVVGGARAARGHGGTRDRALVERRLRPRAEVPSSVPPTAAPFARDGVDVIDDDDDGCDVGVGDDGDRVWLL